MIERIAKLDAAERQLTAAIRLFFQEGDSLAVHTLACAAHDVLQSLMRHRGLGKHDQEPQIRSA
jgi:hypothetical protein